MNAGTVTKLNEAWNKRKELRANGMELCTKGRKLYANGQKLCVGADKSYADGLLLYSEGRKLCSDGDGLCTEGRKLRVDGDLIWANAIISELGEGTKISWEKLPISNDCKKCTLHASESIGNMKFE